MSNRVAVVFDFDDTLAEDSTAALINALAPPPPKRIGDDKGTTAAQVFYDEAADLVSGGWDPPLAYLTLLADKVRSDERTPYSEAEGQLRLMQLPRITRDDLQRVGREKVVVYPGVEPCLRELRQKFAEDDLIKKADLSLDFYIVSGGIGDIIRSTSLAETGLFTEIWASELDYDTAGVVLRPKSTISFTEKTRYLFMINKGISREQSYETPYAVNVDMPDDDRLVPFSHMFYIGDGPSDIPCISTIHRLGTTKDRKGKDNTLLLYGEKTVKKAWEIGTERGRTCPRDYANWAKGNIIEGVIRLGRHIADERLARRSKQLSKDVGYSARRRKKNGNKR